MDEATLARLAEAFGSRIERWPEHERAAAIVFLRDHPAARAVLDAERDLDALLGAAAAAAPTDDAVRTLRDRTMAALTSPPQRGVPRGWRAWWLPGCGLPAAVALGAAVAFALPSLQLIPTAPPPLILALDGGVSVLALFGEGALR